MPQPSDLWNSIVGDWAAASQYLVPSSPSDRPRYYSEAVAEAQAAAQQVIALNEAAFQQSSPVSRHLKILEERFMQAEENILTLTRACQNLRTILEQYELINQELATQVIDLRTKLKTP